MAVPCAGDTCTVSHSTDPGTGVLLAEAHIAQTVELPAHAAGQPIDIHVGSGGVTALQEQRAYRTRRRSANITNNDPSATPGHMTIDHITATDHVANPFGCDAYGLLVYEFRVRGERNADAFDAQDCDPTPPPVDADCTDGETYNNTFYIRAASELNMAGLAPGQVMNPISSGVKQKAEYENYGLWVPSNKGIGDHNILTAWDATTAPTDAARWCDNIWQQEVLMRLTPNQAFDVISTITVWEKWHFDMTGNSGAGRSGNQGAQLRGGSIIFWPADD